MQHPRTASLIIAALLAALLVGCSSRPRVNNGSQPLGGDLGVYKLKKLHELDGLGLFGMEVVLANINTDPFPDLVMSSGEVASPQPLVVYFNTQKNRPFLDRPSWYSGNIAHRGALAVGDIDINGRPDLVVPVLYNNAAKPGSGELEVFLTDIDGSLPERPSYVLEIPGVPLSVTLGDVDADGDVDAVVASVGTLKGGIGTQTTQHIYFNRERTLRTDESWTGPTLAAVSVLLSDLDQDGWLDLVIGGDRVAIVHGGEKTFASPWEPNTSWLETPLSAAFGLSAGRIAPNRGLSLVVADNCRNSEGCKLSGLWLFEPDSKGLPSKDGRLLRELENGSHVRIFDGNNDGNADLVVTQLGKKELGAPALLLQGDSGGRTFSSQFSTEPFQGEGIAIGDPLQDTSEETFTTTEFRGPIVTLSRRHVASIVRVSLDGLELERDRFSWIPGANWVSVAAPASDTKKVEVTYTWSKRHSLVLASYDPRTGPKLMFSDYTEGD